MTSPCERRQAATDADTAGELAAWAASGAMWLTGRPDSMPLGPPAGLVDKLGAIGDVVTRRTAALGTPTTLDPLALLGERAALAGLCRGGSTSCGGATRLLPTSDGWVAVTLARPDDVELIPAWLQVDEPGRVDYWPTVTAAVAGRPADELTERARLLGLPVADLPGTARSPTRAAPPLAPLPVRARSVASAASPAPATSSTAGLLVVDLSALWAGPLCGGLLAEAGADVVKVESTSRPDGARHGPARFFDVLNAGKRAVALDLRSREGARRLHELLARADVVIEASRPRALAQLGIDPESLLGRGGPRVWVSITGYGRTGPGADRVAFGDDAAVAGGLACWDARGPCFCADAVADPVAGLVAAAAVLEALAAGGRWFLDVAMAEAAAHLAGPTLTIPGTDPPPGAVPPRARPAQERAPRLGEHTGSVLADLERRS
ncbi:MAG: CoA transferase [Acidimicrobiia bacterium]